MGVFYASLQEKQREVQKMINKTFKRNGSAYKVLAYNEKEQLMLMECISGDFAGDISCLTGAHYDGEALRASGNITYFISKAQFFARAGECKSKDIGEIASYIRQKYFRIPTVICLLIAEAYLAETHS